MISFKSQIAKVAKPRPFSYLPRYYDERKEKLAEIKRKINQDEKDKASGEKKFREFKFRSAMNDRWRGEEYKSAVRRSNLVIFTIIVALITVGYYLMNKIDFIKNLWEAHG